MKKASGESAQEFTHRLYSDPEPKGWSPLVVVLAIALGIAALSSFSGVRIDLRPHKFSPTIQHWSWWGLQKTDKPLIWKNGEWMMRDGEQWITAVADNKDAEPVERDSH